MASVKKYRNKWLKYHKGYEKKSLNALMKVFKSYNEIVIATDLNINDYKEQIANAVKIDSLIDAYYSIYYFIGATHGQRVGKDINLNLKEFTFESFMELFQTELELYFRQLGFNRIQLVHQSYLEDIYRLFNDNMKAGMTFKETTDEIHRLMRSPRFYRWQAERIARTETTAAANYAAIQSGRVTGFVMEKQWISAQDARTRRKPKADYDHYFMNGKRVGLKEKFLFNPNSLNIDQLEYPGDPKGQAGNIINCRCTVAVVPKRDKNGNLIRIS